MRVSDRLWRLLRAELNSRLGNFDASKAWTRGRTKSEDAYTGSRRRSASRRHSGQAGHQQEGQGYRDNGASTERYQTLLKHYSALELSYGATLPEVKLSYKRLVKQYHPDRFQDPAKRADATELLKHLNASYAAVLAHLEAQGA